MSRGDVLIAETEGAEVPEGSPLLARDKRRHRIRVDERPTADAFTLRRRRFDVDRQVRCSGSPEVTNDQGNDLWIRRVRFEIRSDIRLCLLPSELSGVPE